jgi:hypothetical protein
MRVRVARVLVAKLPGNQIPHDARGRHARWVRKLSDGPKEPHDACARYAEMIWEMTCDSERTAPIFDT